MGRVRLEPATTDTSHTPTILHIKKHSSDGEGICKHLREVADNLREFYTYMPTEGQKSRGLTKREKARRKPEDPDSSHIPTTIHILTSGLTTSQLVRRSRMICCHLDVHLHPEYVGKHVIIRSGAHGLSRRAVDDLTTLRPEVFGRLANSWGWSEADLFASAGTAQRDRHGQPLPYYSRLPDLRSLACPRGTVTLLVLPNWPAQPWHAKLAASGAETMDLGDQAWAALTPAGQLRHIESDATERTTRLRAWRVQGRG